MRQYVRRLARFELDNQLDLSQIERFWIGRQGPVTANGIGQAMSRRAREAAVEITYGEEWTRIGLTTCRSPSAPPLAGAHTDAPPIPDSAGTALPPSLGGLTVLPASEPRDWGCSGSS